MPINHQDHRFSTLGIRALREHAKKVAALEAERLNPKPKPKAAPAANPLAPLPMQEYKVDNILALCNQLLGSGYLSNYFHP